MTKKGRIEIKQGRLYFLGLQVRTKQKTSCLESFVQGSSSQALSHGAITQHMQHISHRTLISVKTRKDKRKRDDLDK